MKTHPAIRRAVSIPLAALTIGAGSLLAGCGSDSDNDPAGKEPIAVNTVKIQLDEQTGRFTPDATDVKSGMVQIQVNNPTTAKRKHGVALVDGKRRTMGAAVKPGRTTGLTIQLKPGKYQIVDSVKGAQNKGYVTNLTVIK